MFGFPHLPFSCNNTKETSCHIYYKTIHNCFLFLLTPLLFTANFMSFCCAGICTTRLLLFVAKPHQGLEKLVYRGLIMFTNCLQEGLKHSFCNVSQNEALQNNNSKFCVIKVYCLPHQNKKKDQSLGGTFYLAELLRSHPSQSYYLF